MGFDSFGQDGYFEPTWKSKSDQAKLETMLALAEDGFEDQLIMAQDMHKKHYLLRYGGFGYNHVLARVVPRMKPHLRRRRRAGGETAGDEPGSPPDQEHTTPRRKQGTVLAGSGAVCRAP